jgi:hypothetical protein
MSNYNIHEKEVISNIIGLNPTGTLSFNGTFTMNGSNSIINTQENISKDNLKKTETNEFIHKSNVIENFESYHIKSTIHKYNIFLCNKDYIYIILIIFLFLLFIIICNKK